MWVVLRNFLRLCSFCCVPSCGTKKGVKDSWARWNLVHQKFTWDKLVQGHYREVLWEIRCHRDFEAVWEWLDHGDNITWWSWDSGSCWNLWRWSEEFRYFIRDGQKQLFTGIEPKLTRPQKLAIYPKLHKREAHKTRKVRQKGYIEPERVTYLPQLFSVTKSGNTDIHMLYNGTSSGLNKVFCHPHYSIPNF